MTFVKDKIGGALADAFNAGYEGKKGGIYRFKTTSAAYIFYEAGKERKRLDTIQGSNPNVNNTDKARKAISAMLRERRKQKGITTSDLAERLKTAQPRITELESGNGKVKNIDAYIAAARALGGEITITWKE